jgi:hypothetical protein
VNLRRRRRDRNAYSTDGLTRRRRPCELIVSTSRGGRRLQLFELPSASIYLQRLPACFIQEFSLVYMPTPGTRQIRTTEQTPTRSMHHGACVASLLLLRTDRMPPSAMFSADTQVTIRVRQLRVPYHLLSGSKRSARTPRSSYLVRMGGGSDSAKFPRPPDSQKLACSRKPR